VDILSAYVSLPYFPGRRGRGKGVGGGGGGGEGRGKWEGGGEGGLSLRDLP
jgi:hypothetical protein